MIIKLFLTFIKIGLFTFGGGYAMIPIIENICVDKNIWIMQDENDAKKYIGSHIV